ncbi:hypothetical protein GWK47_012620 [Chionoecetes opilio]|uniref:Uncharacterized protein n=1 Tax=Chionoecetes opilio TaxID=41210 RepID=A0A8J4Y172_CHIOP|nr:hypothetical protein GWK47_012620 [Chionoecetes opilio]
MPRLQVLRIGPFASGVLSEPFLLRCLASSPPPPLPPSGWCLLRPPDPLGRGVAGRGHVGYAGAPFVWKGSPRTFACGKVASWSSGGITGAGLPGSSAPSPGLFAPGILSSPGLPPRVALVSRSSLPGPPHCVSGGLSAVGLGRWDCRHFVVHPLFSLLCLAIWLVTAPSWPGTAHMLARAMAVAAAQGMCFLVFRGWSFLSLRASRRSAQELSFLTRLDRALRGRPDTLLVGLNRWRLVYLFSSSLPLLPPESVLRSAILHGLGPSGGSSLAGPALVLRSVDFVSLLCSFWGSSLCWRSSLPGFLPPYRYPSGVSLRSSSARLSGSLWAAFLSFLNRSDLRRVSGSVVLDFLSFLAPNRWWSSASFFARLASLAGRIRPGIRPEPLFGGPTEVGGFSS